MFAIIQAIVFLGLMLYAVLAAFAIIVAPMNLGVLDRFLDRILRPWV